MTEKNIEVYKQLKIGLDDFLQEGKAYKCLKLMCDITLEHITKGYELPRSFTRSEIKIFYDGTTDLVDQMDFKDIQKWISDKQLNKAIENHLIMAKGSFNKIGYIPIIRKNLTNGGSGNERRYWLDIEEIKHNFTESSEEDNDLGSNQCIEYSRTDPSLVKIMWFYKIIFKNGELKNRSLRGLLLFVIFISSLILYLLLILIVSIYLVPQGKLFSSFDIFAILALIILCWHTYKYNFVPIWNLPDHRVVKAPSFFLAISTSVLNVDMEMYRDTDGNKITRFTQFIATCPICASNIILKEGYPDHKKPLVGRCVESPFSHVYSFDRVTMKGKFLG